VRHHSSTESERNGKVEVHGPSRKKTNILAFSWTDEDNESTQGADQVVGLEVILTEQREHSTLKCARSLLDRLRKTMKALRLQASNLYSTHI
jgi:hypothetical protein